MSRCSLYGVLVAVLMLCMTQRVHGDVRSANYKTLHGSGMKANLASQYLIHSSVTASKIACGWRCRKEPVCVSYNWFRNTSVCELFKVYAWTQNISAFFGGDYYAYFPEDNVCDVADPCQNQGLCIPSGPDGYQCDCPGLWWGQNCTICGGQPKIISNDVDGPNDSRTMSIPIITETCASGEEAPQYVVLMRRQDGSVNFYLNWTEFKEGFGDMNGEFWIGNENMHYLTNNGTNYKLRVDLRTFSGLHGYAEYDHFSVGPETDKYRLSLGSFIPGGTAGDSLYFNRGMQFSTPDSDNDVRSDHCAQVFEGAWWHSTCYHTQLTSRYSAVPDVPFAMGVVWKAFAGFHESLAFADMKLYV